MSDLSLRLNGFNQPEITNGDPLLNGILLSLHIKRGEFFVNPEFGSRLHEIKTATPQDAALAKQYVERSLRWLIEDGLANSIAVSVEIPRPQVFHITIIADGNKRTVVYSVNPPAGDDEPPIVLSGDTRLNVFAFIPNSTTNTTSNPQQPTHLIMSGGGQQNQQTEFVLGWNLIYEFDKIVIIAEPVCPKATVTGAGEHNAEVGWNTYNVTVTAEDGTAQTYTIQLQREDQEPELCEDCGALVADCVCGDTIIDVDPSSIVLFTRDEALNSDNHANIRLYIDPQNFQDSPNTYRIDYFITCPSGKTLNVIFYHNSGNFIHLRELPNNIWRIRVEFFFDRGAYPNHVDMVNAFKAQSEHNFIIHYTDWSPIDKNSWHSYLPTSEYAVNRNVEVWHERGFQSWANIWGHRPTNIP